MQVTDLLTPERIRVDAHAGSKKRLLEIVSALISQDDDQLESREVFESLCAREQLGSTGLGHGVAIPHGRVSRSNNVKAAFLRLRNPIDFDASDEQPVDLLFALTVPQNCTDDHLKLLAQIAELFSDDRLCEQLRQAETAVQLRNLLSDWHH